VFNPDTRELLAVAEKYAERPLSWKLPGGYVKAGTLLIHYVCALFIA